MSEKNKIVIPYIDRSGASIIVTKLIEPYGIGSTDVVSIGVTLKGKTDDPTWKIHVPISLVESVCHAMQAMSLDTNHINQATNEEIQ